MSRHLLTTASASSLGLLLLAGCSALLGIPSDVDDSLRDAGNETSINGEGGGNDAGADQSVADGSQDSDADGAGPMIEAGPLCDPAKDFLAPTVISSITKTGTEGSPRLTEDELTMYFAAQLNGDPYTNLYFAKRGVLTDSFFGITAVAGGVNTPANYEFQPNVTLDGLSMYFERQDPISEDSDLYMATRATMTSAFGVATPIPGVNSNPGYDAKIFMRGDGSEFYYSKADPANGGRTDILVANKSGATYVTTVLPVVNETTSNEYAPVISKDRLTLYFSSDRPGGQGSFDIYVAQRALVTDDFGAPVLVPSLNSAQFDEAAWISVDGCRLYMTSQRVGGGKQAVYVAKRPL